MASPPPPPPPPRSVAKSAKAPETVPHQRVDATLSSARWSVGPDARLTQASTVRLTVVSFTASRFAWSQPPQVPRVLRRSSTQRRVTRPSHGTTKMKRSLRFPLETVVMW